MKVMKVVTFLGWDPSNMDNTAVGELHRTTSHVSRFCEEIEYFVRDFYIFLLNSLEIASRVNGNVLL